MDDIQSRRVVSLLPSATDILIALDCQSLLVGCSHECPESVWSRAATEQPNSAGVPRILTQSRLGKSTATSNGINNDNSTSGSQEEELDFTVEIQEVFSASVAAVQEMSMLGPALAAALIQFGLSVYQVDPNLLAQSMPDIILTCLQTAHGGVLEGHLSDTAFESVLGYIPRVVSCQGETLGDIYNDIDRVAEAVGVKKRGTALVESMKSRMREVHDMCRGRGHPRVACIQWPAPLLTCGAWVPELMECIGVRQVVGEDGPGASLESVADCDVIVCALCGMNLDTSRRVVRKLIDRYNGHDKRWIVMDGTVMLNRPGPLLLPSLESLAESIYPEIQSMYNVAVAPEIRMAPPIAPPTQRYYERVSDSGRDVDNTKLKTDQGKKEKKMGNTCTITNTTNSTAASLGAQVEGRGRRRRRTVGQLVQTIHDAIVTDTTVDQVNNRCIPLGIASAIAITDDDMYTSTVINDMSLDATRVIQTVISVLSPQTQDDTVIVGAVIESYKKLGYFDASDVIQSTFLSP